MTGFVDIAAVVIAVSVDEAGHPRPCAGTRRS
jgi:hypothetical protein